MLYMIYGILTSSHYGCGVPVSYRENSCDSLSPFVSNPGIPRQVFLKRTSAFLTRYHESFGCAGSLQLAFRILLICKAKYILG